MSRRVEELIAWIARPEDNIRETLGVDFSGDGAGSACEACAANAGADRKHRRRYAEAFWQTENLTRG